MTAEESATLLSVLARLELGVEPDVRFGAATLAPGPAVLFRLGRPSRDRPGARFAAAAAIARCAAAVASAAGPLDPRGPVADALVATITGLAAGLRLEPGEDLRLSARLCWLLSTRVDVERLGRQTTAVTEAEREIAGHYLITVAVVADPVIGPATVGVLTRVYRILGLPAELVFGRLHERSTGGGPALARLAAGSPPIPASEPAADEPVVVEVGDGAPSGFALPWARLAGFRLDPALISQKVAESGTAAALLRAIFEDEEEPSVPDLAVPGLDRAHGALLRALAAFTSWSREDFVTLAAEHGVMPDGALDLLNEVAIDTVGAPVVEGDTILTVANDVLLELLA